MSRYIFVAHGMLPIVAFAESKSAMRQYVRDCTGLAVLPRHAVVRIAP